MKLELNVNEAMILWELSERYLGGYAEAAKLNGYVATAVSCQEGSDGPELTLETEEDFIARIVDDDFSYLFGYNWTWLEEEEKALAEKMQVYFDYLDEPLP